MCGRYSLTSPEEAMRQLFAHESPPLNIRARYNIAPTQTAPVVRQTEGGGREMVPLRWGLVPFWADTLSIGAKMINARSETVAEKPAFRAAFRTRRCLVPATGWYEWKKAGEAGGKPVKQPYAIGYDDQRPFAFAGLWETWNTDGAKGPDGAIETYTIVTRDADPETASLHHRMPVILAPEHWARWLDSGGTPASDLADLLAAATPPGLMHWPVSTRVNKPANDDPDILERAEIGASNGKRDAAQLDLL